MDESEIEKFTELSSGWWEGDCFSTLHRINPLRVEYILSHVGKIDASMSLLDVGCGGGILCESMVRQGFRVTGVDPCKESIDIAMQHAKTGELEIDYHAMDIWDYSSLCKQSKFDVITLMEVVEHVSDFPDLVRSVSGLLKDDGCMFISTLNRTMKSMLLGIIVAEYILNMVPRGTHEWKKFVRPSEIDCILRSNGLIITDIKGISYNIFQDRWFLSDDIDVNYMLVARRPRH